MKKFHIQSFHDKLIKFTLLFYWEIFLFLCFYFKHAAQTRNNGEFGLNDLTIASKHWESFIAKYHYQSSCYLKKKLMCIFFH